MWNFIGFPFLPYRHKHKLWLDAIPSQMWNSRTSAPQVILWWVQQNEANFLHQMNIAVLGVQRKPIRMERVHQSISTVFQRFRWAEGTERAAVLSSGDVLWFTAELQTSEHTAQHSCCLSVSSESCLHVLCPAKRTLCLTFDLWVKGLELVQMAVLVCSHYINLLLDVSL